MARNVISKLLWPIVKSHFEIKKEAFLTLPNPISMKTGNSEN